MEKIIVVDTDIIIDHSREKETALLKLLEECKKGEIKLIVSSITVFEFFTGSYFKDISLCENAKRLFSDFLIQDVNEKIAHVAAEMNRNLNLSSIIGLADLLIAATAIYLNAPLFTKNKKHFKLIPGIKFYKNR